MHTKTRALLLAIVVSASAGWLLGQSGSPESRTGPVIDGYGPAYDVAEPDFVTPVAGELKAVFDVASSPSSPDAVNRSIETVARYLNMHARAGVSEERLAAALVLHGGAGKAALSDAAYEKRYGVPNPSSELLERLRSAGVEVILCGQTAASRGFDRSELAAPVELALSAMTALVSLQRDGYALIAF